MKRVLIPVVGVVVLLLIAGAATTVVHGRGVGLAVAELADGTAVTPSGVERVSITTADAGGLDRVTVHVDGQPVQAQRVDGRMTLTGVKLTEGRHTLSVRVANPLPWMPDMTVEREFTVDSTPPTLNVEVVEAESPRGPVTVRGTAEGADTVRVGDQQVPVTDGRFEASLTSVSLALACALAWAALEAALGGASR